MTRGWRIAESVSWRPKTYVLVATDRPRATCVYAPLTSALDRFSSVQIYDLILVAQEIATHLLGSTSDATIGSPAEVELAKRGTGAVEWLTRALRLGEAAERAGGGNAYGGSKVKVCTEPFST